MSIKCNVCINKDSCKDCKVGWEDKFIPNNEVKHFFEHCYAGTIGINGYVWSWNSTNSDLKPTHRLDIYGKNICPYCGEEMYPIQNKNLDVIGYCCLCKGAQAELEYESKKTDMKNRHTVELQELQNYYKSSLTFCSKKLLEIKQQEEQRLAGFFDKEFTHFNTKEEIEFD